MGAPDIDTAGMQADECCSRMPGSDEYDAALPEGAAIAVLLFVAALVALAGVVVFALFVALH